MKMEIKITRNVEGAKEAEGIVVIIDVFRAFSTVYYIIEKGAKKIIPFDENEIAFDIKKENSSCLIIGEYKGTKIDGFDYGNSPSDVKKLDFKNRNVLLKTSKGTKGLINVDKDKADEIIIGSFLCIDAIINHIKKKNPEKVTLVCMGEPDDSQSYEDEICAECIKDGFQGKEVNYKQIYNLVKNSPASKRFYDNDIEHTPKEDFELCMDFNSFDYIIKYDPKERYLYVPDEKEGDME